MLFSAFCQCENASQYYQYNRTDLYADEGRGIDLFIGLYIAFVIVVIAANITFEVN